MSFNKFSDTKIYSSLEVADHPTITTKKATFNCNGDANFKTNVILENGLIVKTIIQNNNNNNITQNTTITNTNLLQLATVLTTKL